MKNALVLADMEGCCGISELSNPVFCLNRMIEEVDYVVQLLRELGDYCVTVLDCHNDGLNLKEYCFKNNIPFINHVWSFSANIQFDIALLVGFHGKEGADGYLSHTVRADIRDIRLGEISVGEVSLLQNWLASSDIPVVYISGDQSIKNELYLYDGEFLPVKGVQVGVPPLSEQKQKIKSSICSAIEKATRTRYCNDSVHVQLRGEGYVKFIPPECFVTKSNEVVFRDTVDFFEKLPLFCSFLNIASQYQFVRFKELKNNLRSASKEYIFRHEQARRILENNTWRSLSDDDYLYLYSLIYNDGSFPNSV